jgi:hypothetical protein
MMRKQLLTLKHLAECQARGEEKEWNPFAMLPIYVA